MFEGSAGRGGTGALLFRSRSLCWWWCPLLEPVPPAVVSLVPLLCRLRDPSWSFDERLADDEACRCEREWWWR